MSDGEAYTDRACSFIGEHETGSLAGHGVRGVGKRTSRRPILNKTIKPCLTLLFGAILFLGAHAAVSAAVFTVTKTADTNDGVCNADCSLREAIASANGLAGNDVIVFDASVFRFERTIILSGTPLTIANNGSLTIKGTGPALLTISGNNLSGVIVVDPQAVVIISGSTIANGNTAGNGGGISNNGGDLTLNSSIVRNNTAGLGGGIFNNSVLTITNSVIGNNNAGAVGGGIYNFFSGTLTVTDSTISGNTVTDGIGGGIANGGFVTLAGVTIGGNRAEAVANPDGGMGGGVFTGGVMSAVNSTIKDNSAIRGGGFGTRGGSLTISASTINNNQAGTGSGICNGCSSVDSGGATANLTNTTISGNSAYNLGGGGIYNTNHNTVDLEYSTLSGNAGPTAGGIFNLSLGTVTAHGTIIADNSATSGPAPDFQGTLTSQGYNLVESTGGTTMAGTAKGNIIGLDPRLGPLANNGGPTLTRSLLPDSPAIDSADGASFPLTDQRGVSRPRSIRGTGSRSSDIGAFELAVLSSDDF